MSLVKAIGLAKSGRQFVGGQRARMEENESIGDEESERKSKGGDEMEMPTVCLFNRMLPPRLDAPSSHNNLHQHHHLRQENITSASNKLMTPRHTATTTTATATMLKLMLVALILQQISRPQFQSQVQCSPQVFSVHQQKSLGQTAPGGGPQSSAVRRVARTPTAIEEPAEFIVEDASATGAGNRHLEEATNRRQAPEIQPLNTNHLVGGAGGSKLRIVRLLAPEASQNGTQNVTLDCMFKFDKNLDQRLTIKWFFNDELEPIYQWIPELNKRVYSDKYERYLDKSYEVSEDVDFMLQSYRWLLAAAPAGSGQSNSIDANGASMGNSEETVDEELDTSRRLLAGRLNKLAKMGGRHSRQLIESLRAALLMDEPEFSRFRALRLIRPTSELNGRYTCSVSSLDGDDLRSTRLVVYEPAKSFSFNVSRLATGQQYNLSCQAGHIFPRPTLALFRYRAGPLDQPNGQAANSGPAGSLRQHANRPKLAATLLRQEPIAGTQTQITISAGRQAQRFTESQDPNDIRELATELDNNNNNNNFLNPDQLQPQPTVYGISSWVLVDESTLSSNVVTQFECQLYIEGTGYEQRQSLALQRGWHVNSAALTSRHTLVGLFSALASLLCLMLALVSSMLIFRLLKRHAKNRVHQQLDKSDSPDGSGSETNGANPTVGSHLADRPTNTLTDMLTPASGLGMTTEAKGNCEQFGATNQQEQASKQARSDSTTDNSDGVYRVPMESKSYGTRFIIGPGSGVGHYYGGDSNLSIGPGGSFASSAGKQQPNYQQQRPRYQQQQHQQRLHQPSPAIISLEHSKPLYC